MGDGNIHLDTPPPSLKVLTSVAEHEGVDETNLPPLSVVIDPDALNRLFVSSPTEKQKKPAYVSFPYAGSRVIVYDNGNVVVDS